MLTSLTTRGFRNLANGRWPPDPGINLVYGPNGAGKSSLLEAIYLASTTRSFRTPRLAECVRLGGETFYVAAEAEGDERTLLEVSWEAQGKRRAVNGATGAIGEHLSVLPTVCWTTRDNEIFQGPPEVRRRLMDRGIVSQHPASLAILREYRGALDAKRAALERQLASLEEWNRLLARSGAELVRRRSRWVERLEAALGKVLDGSRLDLGEVELRYRPSPRQGLEGEEALLAALTGLEGKERGRRSVLAGPHRDELEIIWRHGRVGRMASAGERKLLGLALMVAQSDLLVEGGTRPIWLVDDLDAELDLKRVDEVWAILGQAPQLIAATSRKSVVSRLPADFKWSLEGGIVAEFGGSRERGL